MSNPQSLALQQRRWLLVVVVAVILLATSFALTLATLPSHPLQVEWGRPIAVRIPPTRGTHDETLINAISCTSATACSAGGFISTSATSEAIAFDETNGVWHRADVIKGTPTSETGSAMINAISCSSPGNCGAGGSFVNVATPNRAQSVVGDAPTTAFVVNEVHGRWRVAHAVTGVVAPGHEKGASITFLSCTSAGNCAAAGRYSTVGCADGDSGCVLAGADYKRQFERSFVVDEVDGVWGPPEFLRNANRGEYPNLNGLSCGAPGQCVAVGTSASPSNEGEGFIANEVNGKWQSATLFPGTELPGQTSSSLAAVSCGSRGNCSAGGSYTDKLGNTHPFLVDETAGTWHRAFAVQGSTRLALNRYAQVQSIACASSRCTAFGESLGTPGKGLYYFVLSKGDGEWSPVRLVPWPSSATFKGFSGSEMACSLSGSCAIAGSYFTLAQSTTPYALSFDADHFTHIKNLRGVEKLMLGPTAGSVVALSCGARDDCVTVEFFGSLDIDTSFFVQESLR